MTLYACQTCMGSGEKLKECSPEGDSTRFYVPCFACHGTGNSIAVLLIQNVSEYCWRFAKGNILAQQDPQEGDMKWKVIWLLHAKHDEEFIGLAAREAALKYAVALGTLARQEEEGKDINK